HIGGPGNRASHEPAGAGCGPAETRAVTSRHRSAPRYLARDGSTTHIRCSAQTRPKGSPGPNALRRGHGWQRRRFAWIGSHLGRWPAQAMAPVNGRLDPVCHSELRKNAGNMVLGCAGADAQLRGYLVVVQTARNKFQYLQFAGRELLPRRLRDWLSFHMLTSHPI